MSDLATIRPLLKSLIANLSGLDCKWSDQPDQYTSSAQRAVCDLSISSPQSVGWDQLTTLEDDTQPQGNELQDRIDGIRKFVLKIKCTSYEQGDSKTALSYLESVRTRMSFRSTIERLHSVNVAWTGDKALLDIPTMSDGRAVSIAVLDLAMAFWAIETDPNRYGYISTINGGDGPTFDPNP